MAKSRVDCVLEVHVNENWFWCVQHWLLNEVKRSPLLDKEIVVCQVEKFFIVVVRNVEASRIPLGDSTQRCLRTTAFSSPASTFVNELLQPVTLVFVQ